MANLLHETLFVLSLAFSLSTATPVIRPRQAESPVKSSTALQETLKFIATNYIAHAFTVSIAAGYGSYYSILFAFASLFFPYIGLVTACRSLEQLAVLEPDPLKRAARAGALCMVVRTKFWEPKRGDKVWCWQQTPQSGNDEIERTRLDYEGLELEYLAQRYIKIHGLCRLPLCKDGRNEYMMARVPPDFEVKWTHLNHNAQGVDFNKTIAEKRNETTVGQRGDSNEGKGYIPVVAEEVPAGGELGNIGLIDNPPTNSDSSPQPKAWIKKSQYEISGTHSYPKAAMALIQLFSAIPWIVTLAFPARLGMATDSPPENI